ncbi:hypothetical protein A3A01_01810 [Candidatus Nomurabacteria bacterium RIFCSPLOWO2_01_FULL_39_17]|uniref:Uncharacterized protein n=1 Tax=Candidatus Nomurabacteria bacterium RIFCSPLOWO2_01_FULL_39_17 TaxID=1801770 RepID=A0A1F6WV81_9BACT|nr:MAG: hypothetical protein A3A01_01810 [Candidatus Nomurabacteria bacterium RIFCSPLOWO2_01_FULL_39_17]
MVIFLFISPSGRNILTKTFVSTLAALAVTERDFLPIPDRVLFPSTNQEIKTLSRFAENVDKVIIVFSYGAGLDGFIFTEMLDESIANAEDMPIDINRAGIASRDNIENLNLII